MSESGAEVEQESLEDLEQFVHETDEWIDSITQSLGWTREHILQPEHQTTCPVNPRHTVSQKSLNQHLHYCSLLSKGYSRQEIDADRSSKFFYEKAPTVLSIDLDETTVHNILQNVGGKIPAELPQTMSRAVDTFSAAQKLRIYEYCVEVARAANASGHIADEELAFLEDKKADRPLSKLEMLAKMRDLKRRRQSYRGKNTHTSKKNHTEIIRDVLNNQMELLANIWAEEAKEKEEKRKKEQAEKHAEKSDRSRGRKRSSSRSQSRSRTRDGRSHHKESGSKKSSRHHSDSVRKDSNIDDTSRQHKRARSRSHSHGHRSHKKHKKHSHQSRERSRERSREQCSSVEDRHSNTPLNVIGYDGPDDAEPLRTDQPNTATTNIKKENAV